MERLRATQRGRATRKPLILMPPFYGAHPAHPRQILVSAYKKIPCRCCCTQARVQAFYCLYGLLASLFRVYNNLIPGFDYY